MNDTDIVLPQLVRRDTVHYDTAAALLGDMFIIAAEPLFVLAARLKQFSRDVDPLQLQETIIQDVCQFELQLQQRNIRAEQIFIAKYFICALLDDLIEYEWFQGDGLWRAYALLNYFFQEHPREDKLFSLIERLQQEPTVNIALIELAYMVLIYGYQGACRQSNQGYMMLLQKMDELYQLLSNHYGDFRKSLFIQARS